jgi:catechol 2,3-dioxygenase-like lactoylglutathione lyase family enzyme
MIRFNRVSPNVPVADLDRTIAFYTKHFGFDVGVCWPEDNPTFCILDRDAIRIAFCTIDSRPDFEKTGQCDLHIDVTNIAEIHESLKDSLPVEWGPEVFFYGRREFAVRDPDGYLVIFSEVTSDPPTCLAE